MDKNDLGDYNGMLFVFGDEGRNSFWINKTEIALDLIFINSSKEVVEIIKCTAIAEVIFVQAYP
jgi:uncharacterized membrane protein (UPF0127 family)